MSEEKWYVLGSLTRNQELKIRDELRRESLNCFVPLRYVVKTVKGVRTRMMVPALSGLMFVQGTLDQLKETLKFHKGGLYLRKSTFSNKEEYLTVSNHDMQNFIAVTEQAGEKITYFSPDEIQLRPGDRIRVSGGLYDGREGVIMRVKGKRKKQLVVSIPGILIASVEMEPELVEVLNKKSEQSKPAAVKSKDVEEDKKLLMRLSKRLLFEISSAYQHEKEYYLLLTELKHAASRLTGVKGFIPSREAELALPLYLAAVKLGEGVTEAEQRLRAAIAKLQPTSLLRLRCQMYLGILSHDDELSSQVAECLSNWKDHKCSIPQRFLLEEYELVKK